MAVKDGNKRIAVTCTSQIEKELELLSKNIPIFKCIIF